MSKRSNPTLQSVILNLQQFWADQGCVIWQPYHTEVGAGTMNPATFLRVLGPEPWWVAYVEPSIRPADGRYGENPNRWQHFYQFQVILKPDPGDPVERYLQSLVALGIRPEEHDIRFVEDNWIAPALGAWGLGWEVWLDGQEITQYTYFQQAGGQTLDPVSVEITYGLERIVLALQDVDNFVDIRWNEHLTYGDINLTAEKEHSRYNFETADVERLRVMYDEFEAEAKACLAASMVFPALDYVLKCSHTFNLMDARGAIGVTERALLFGRMRDIARHVAEQYVAQREALGYPWKGRWQIPTPALEESTDEIPAPDAPALFLLEVGTEELPAGDLDVALEQLKTAVGRMLEESRLPHGAIQVFGTPRRLVVRIEDLAPAQDDQVSLAKGPPADRAFDSKGKPTKAAVGFARSKHVAVEELDVRELDGGRYVVAEIREPGESADKVLKEALPALIASLHYENSMRWNNSGVTFSRPIRWLLALHGEHVVPFVYAELTTKRETRMLRFDEPETRAIQDAGQYFEIMKSRGIVLDVEARKQAITKQISRLAAEVGAVIQEDEALLSEVANLVEKPTALRGTFDDAFLELPEQVLISVMKNHQRAFPVQREDTLLPYFIIVRNGGKEHLDIVTRGNEQVIGARFTDAAYFIRRDLEHPLESFVPRLDTLTFQTKLGSMLDKTHRIERLTGILAKDLALDSEEKKVALRAAQLSKADLVSRMVVEMTSLQGEMGREYATHHGEPERVAQAILDHYLPRFAGDRMPSSTPGLIVGIADRMDTIVGLFAAGIQPTGARDPFAMRRTAIGLIQNLISHDLRFDLRRGLSLAAEGLPIEASEEDIQASMDFIVTREQVYLFREGSRHDAVESVLAAQGYDPAGAAQAVEALEKWRARQDWDEILQAYARCARITRAEKEIYTVDPAQFVEQGERSLFKGLERAEKAKRGSGSVDDFFNAFLPLIPVITTFFEDVLVMAEEKELRSNRLGLLQRIVALANGVVDLGRLEGF